MYTAGGKDNSIQCQGPAASGIRTYYNNNNATSISSYNSNYNESIDGKVHFICIYIYAHIFVICNIIYIYVYIYTSCTINLRKTVQHNNS